MWTQRVNWAGLRAGTACKRLALPTYPFQRQRHWFSEEASNITVPVASGPAAEVLPYDPWLGHTVESASGEILFLQRYSATTPFLVRDHRIRDAIILPAAAHIATVLVAADRLLGGGPYLLSEIAFTEVLVFDADKQCWSDAALHHARMASLGK